MRLTWWLYGERLQPELLHNSLKKTRSMQAVLSSSSQNQSLQTESSQFLPTVRAEEQPSTSKTRSSGSLQKNKHLHLGCTVYVFNDNQSVWTKHLKFHMNSLMAFSGNISRWRMTHLFAEITQFTQQPGLFQGGVLLFWEGGGWDHTHSPMAPRTRGFLTQHRKQEQEKDQLSRKKAPHPSTSLTMVLFKHHQFCYIMRQVDLTFIFQHLKHMDI